MVNYILKTQPVQNKSLTSVVISSQKQVSDTGQRSNSKRLQVSDDDQRYGTKRVFDLCL